MLPLDHPLWKELEGGYRSRFDASVPLRELFAGGDSQAVWELLWDELHHQGDVGDASYATVPYLVRWIEQSERLAYDPIALITVIENCRQQYNPQPREILAKAYFDALQQALEVVVKHNEHPWSDRITSAAIWLLSVVKGNANYAQFLDYFSAEDAKDWAHENEMFNWVDQ